MKDVESLKQVKQVVDVSFHDVLFSTEDPTLLDGTDDVDDGNNQQLQPLAGAKCVHALQCMPDVSSTVSFVSYRTHCAPAHPVHVHSVSSTLRSAHPLLTLSPLLPSYSHPVSPAQGSCQCCSAPGRNPGTQGSSLEGKPRRSCCWPWGSVSATRRIVHGFCAAQAHKRCLSTPSDSVFAGENGCRGDHRCIAPSEMDHLLCPLASLCFSIS